MGIYVNLNMFPEQIDSKAWLAAYTETLRLLRAWPGGILGLREETVAGLRRLSYSSDFEHDQDDLNQRRWRVEGDRESGKTGETFELYANLDRYRRSEEVIKRDHGSLLANLTCRGERGYTVFDSKTQGHPYHYAMLAVAMLVEDAFPQAALACGDITLDQARKAQQTIRGILGREVALPLAVDGERLLQELIRQMGMEKGVLRFFTAYHGEDGEAIQIAVHNVESSMLHRCYANLLTNYPKPHTLGFRWACQNWMNANGDLTDLIDMACLNEAGPHADPVELAETLVGTWLTAPPDTIRSLPKPEEHRIESPGIGDLLTGSMMRMFGLQGLHTRVYVPVETLLAAFQHPFPDRFEEIRQATLQQHEQLLNKLKELDQEYAQLKEKMTVDQTAGQRSSFTLRDLRRIQPSEPMPDEMVAALDSLAEALQTGIQRLLESAPETATQKPEYIRTVIYMLSNQCGMALTERGWRWIDQEMDLTTMLIILFLISVQNDTQDFVDLRDTLLEYPAAMAAVRSRITIDNLSHVADTQAEGTPRSGQVNTRMGTDKLCQKP